MKSLFVAFALAASASAYLGELCGDGSLGYGTCEEVPWCTANAATNGTTTEILTGFCPDDDYGIKCCVYPRCGGSGICVDTSELDCASAGGSLTADECPGPSSYEVNTLSDEISSSLRRRHMANPM